jgi:spoIIIJ-associated protein
MSEFTDELDGEQRPEENEQRPEENEGDALGAGNEFDEREPASPEEVADTAREFLDGLIDAMGLEAQVATTLEPDSAVIDVTGEDLGMLIGRRGQTLDALQELTRTAVQRRLRSRVRLVVDVEGYRARRRQSLADYARAMAERAKERGTEIELEPMSAYDRKIVHDAVTEIDGASSFSEGQEPNRKVVIRGE